MCRYWNHLRRRRNTSTTVSTAADRPRHSGRLPRRNNSCARPSAHHSERMLQIINYILYYNYYVSVVIGHSRIICRPCVMFKIIYRFACAFLFLIFIINVSDINLWISSTDLWVERTLSIRRCLFDCLLVRSLILAAYDVVPFRCCM